MTREAPKHHPQPLSGLRIIDFTTLLPGPLATLILAEAGAEVIKVERPGGDDMRRLGPRLASGESAAFALLNRGKRIVTLDLKSPADVLKARDLIAEADVLVEQNRPGVMRRLGLGYEQLSERHPRLVYCSITGYGQSGSRAQQVGHDLNYAADAGLLMNTAGSDGEPVLPHALLGDIGGGALPAVLNILLALRQREHTGRGAHIDIAMAECLFTFQIFPFAEKLTSGRACGPGEGLLTGASPRYRMYETSDRRWLAVAALEEKFWRGFCDIVELPESLRDDAIDPAATTAAVASLLRSQSAAHWLQRCSGHDVCVSLVRSFDEALAADELVARGLHDWALPVPVHRGFTAAAADRQVASACDQSGGTR